MLLNASTRRRSSSAERTAIRASKSPRAMRRVARVSRRTGSAMRSASESPIAAPSRMKQSAARWTPRSSSSISRSISRWRWRAARSGWRPLAGADRRRGDHVGEVADRVLVDEAREGDRSRWRGRPRPACASAGSPDANRSRSLVASSSGPTKMLTSCSITWLIQTITSSLPGAMPSLARRQQRVRLLDDALGDGRGARRLALHVVAQQVGEVGADDQREREHRNDRRRARRRGTACGRSSARISRSSARPTPRPRAAGAREERRAEQHQHERHAGERGQLGEVDEVIEQRRRRIAERVDEPAVVREVDVVDRRRRARSVAQNGVARVVDAREQVVGDRPGACGPRV